MKPLRIIIILLSAGILLSILYPFLDQSDDESYVSALTREREDRNEQFKTGDDSPIEKKEQFKGLEYFPADLSFRFQADLEYVNRRELKSLQTSDGKTRSYLTYAWASFDMGNLRHRLMILESLDEGPEKGTLFLAFTDETSGQETYGGGRYLDVRKVTGSTNILLDFNKAYNPYCAYNENFSCPFPPSENHLKIAIRAGEKNYR
jgi:uncharacterized protein